MTDPGTTCFHCADPLPPGPAITAEVMGRERHFCCLGCRAVSETIVQEGLEQFYQQRSAPTVTPQSIDADTRRDCELYDEQNVQDNLARDREDGYRETWLMVEGITCAACIWLIERHLEQRAGVHSISINHSTQRAHLVWNPQEITLSTILLAVRELGFSASPFRPNEWEAQMKAEHRRAMIRIGIAGVVSMQTMMLAYPLQFGLATGDDQAMIQLFRWASWLLATPVVIYSAFPFLQAAIRDLRTRHLTMDVPVSIAIYGGYLASAWVTVQGGEEIYFESISMFTFFLGLGRFLEMRGRYRAGLAGMTLINAMPQTARRQQGDTEVMVPAEQLEIGDQVIIRPGDTVPADGVILNGSSALDESMLTGEYLPVTRHVGEYVSAGTLNTESPLTVQVERAGSQTRLSAIMRMLDRAQQEKPRTAVLADRVASWFVAGVLLAALATLTVWTLLDPGRALAITLSVLVATCPCALSLATPTALTAATSALRERGFLPTRGTTLEGLSSVNTLVFDKTGTLTQGRLSLTNTEVLGDSQETDCLKLAAALEQHSEHPVARAFTGIDTAPIDTVTNHPGLGLTGLCNGRRYAIGTYAFVQSELDLPPMHRHDDGTIAIFLGGQGQWLARFSLDDRLRGDARSTLAQLREAGYHLVMLSGDHSSQVDRVGQSLPLDDWRGNMSPEDKLNHVKELEREGRQVMMVGDGLNDLPVLAGARLSVAVAGASDIARLRADAILLGETLEPLGEALAMAPRTRRTIRQNITLSLCYNASILPLAMAGLVSPWLAALGMSASSVIVVMNALRLGRARSPDAPGPGRDEASGETVASISG